MGSGLGIKKGDVVMVTAGASAGRTGKVLSIQASGSRVVVEGLNLIKKTLRKSQDNPQGGIVDRERAIAISNVNLYCPDCKKGVRKKRVREAGKCVRKCKICDHSFDG